MTLVLNNSPFVFGIDLGTTNSSIAVYFKSEAEIIKIGDDTTLPSVISVRDNGEVIVGKNARSAMLMRPDETVASVKREMGTDWKKEFKGLPGQVYTPSDVAAEVLSALVSRAQEQSTIDLQGTPNKVVICIPANFTDDQKKATRDAAEKANLTVLRLLEEPVAAAVAYALDRNRSQTILVYDLGGGTFDVSILDIKSEEGKDVAMKVLAKEGIEKLGGDDFDERIMKIVADRFQAVSGIDIFDLVKDQEIKKSILRSAQQKLKLAAEQAKKDLALPGQHEAIIDIPSFLIDGSGNEHSVSETITLAEFDDAIRDLVLQSKEAVDRALESAGLGLEDISRIIMVGGSTRVRIVHETIHELFGKEPFRDLDPDTVVARGAAIWGASMQKPLDDEEKERPTIGMTDIVTHNLGIELRGGRFSRLLEKGHEIPADLPLVASRVYATSEDNMTEMRFNVFQADHDIEYVSDEGATFIGEFFLKGVPPKPKGEEKVTVEFQIDQQNMLTVQATSSSSTEALEIKRNA